MVIQYRAHQDCTPLLFNVYTDYIFGEVLQKVDNGIKVNGHYINKTKYADDTVLIEERVNNLQDLHNRVAGKKYELRINEKKKKNRLIISWDHEDFDTDVYGQKIEQVTEFKYYNTRHKYRSLGKICSYSKAYKIWLYRHVLKIFLNCRLTNDGALQLFKTKRMIVDITN